jgi:hypothetical protein
MASDYRYYNRFEFQSVPMEEYEVRDVANRAVGPRLSIKISLVDTRLVFANGVEVSEPVEIRAAIFNNSTVPAEHAVFHWLADVRLEGAPSGFVNRQEVPLRLGASPPAPHYLWQQNWGVPGKLPIWNGMPFNLFDPSYKVRVPKASGTYAIGWSAKAPRMANASKILLIVLDGMGLIQLQDTGFMLDT